MANQQTPRGIRNNNPLNIRRNPANNWIGKIQNPTDKTFEQFTSIEYGIRAAYVLIRNYIRLGRNTPQLIIEKWAPPTENNTNAYVTHACMTAGLKPDEILTSRKRNEIISLVHAMSIVENGKDIGLQPFTFAANLIVWS